MTGFREDVEVPQNVPQSLLNRKTFAYKTRFICRSVEVVTRRPGRYSAGVAFQPICACYPASIQIITIRCNRKKGFIYKLAVSVNYL